MNFCLLCVFFTSQFLCNDNKFGIEYAFDPMGLCASNGEILKMDLLVINSDIVRSLKMIYDIKPGWGEEYPETVSDYFHAENLTLPVKCALGMFTE